MRFGTCSRASRAAPARRGVPTTCARYSTCSGDTSSQLSTMLPLPALELVHPGRKLGGRIDKGILRVQEVQQLLLLVRPLISARCEHAEKRGNPPKPRHVPPQR